MAKTHHSTELAQLASQVSAYAKYGGGAGEDIFAKIKGLIRDLISKLENDAKADATEKAYCDKELAATQAKVGDVEDQLQKLSTQIDRKTAKSTAAKEEVKELQEELAKNMKEQTELDKVRQDEHAHSLQAKQTLNLVSKASDKPWTCFEITILVVHRRVQTYRPLLMHRLLRRLPMYRRRPLKRQLRCRSCSVTSSQLLQI